MKNKINFTKIDLIIQGFEKVVNNDFGNKEVAGIKGSKFEKKLLNMGLTPMEYNVLMQSKALLRADGEIKQIQKRIKKLKELSLIKHYNSLYSEEYREIKNELMEGLESNKKRRKGAGRWLLKIKKRNKFFKLLNKKGFLKEEEVEIVKSYLLSLRASMEAAQKKKKKKVAKK